MSTSGPLRRLKALARRSLPPRVWDGLRVAAGRAVASALPGVSEDPATAANLYEALYEAHGQGLPDEAAVGGGDFDLIGRIELGVLLMEGLRPTDTVVDFGCGTGRLAIHLIPALAGGHYIGIDIATTMLTRADQRVRAAIPAPPCRVTWIKQTGPGSPLETESVDMIGAFSVFTHMEHEDTYRYLKDAARVVRPRGRFILSCLPMTLEAARRVFLESARDDLRARWRKVRNVTTSVDLVTTVAELAGWTPIRWYAGDEPNIRVAATGELRGLGQSVCVLAKTPPAAPRAR